MLEDKAKIFVLKNLEDVSEEMTKVGDLKLSKPILDEAKVGDSIVRKVERHSARGAGKAECRRLLKSITMSKGHRDIAKFTVARLKRKVLRNFGLTRKDL